MNRVTQLIEVITSSLVTRLQQTVATGWRDKPRIRNSHWETKQNYYRAVIQYVEDHGASGLHWKTVVQRAGGCDSTFYDVVGTSARHSLLRAYAGTDLTSCYERSEVVERLIDEAKVWAYWPVRTGWLTELKQVDGVGPAAAAECLIRVLAVWADRNPKLAEALDHAPPICAVEDLLVIDGASRTSTDAVELLRRVVRLALSPLGVFSDGVINAVRHELRGDVATTTPAHRESLAWLAEGIIAVSLEPESHPEAAALRAAIPEGHHA